MSNTQEIKSGMIIKIDKTLLPDNYKNTSSAYTYSPFIYLSVKSIQNIYQQKPFINFYQYIPDFIFKQIIKYEILENALLSIQENYIPKYITITDKLITTNELPTFSISAKHCIVCPHKNAPGC